MRIKSQTWGVNHGKFPMFTSNLTTSPALSGLLPHCNRAQRAPFGTAICPGALDVGQAAVIEAGRAGQHATTWGKMLLGILKYVFPQKRTKGWENAQELLQHVIGGGQK